MSTRIEKLKEIQKSAVETWIKSNFNCTLQIATGVGKTKISIDCLYHCLDNRLFKKNKPKIRFWAESTAREKTIMEDEVIPYFTIMGRKYLDDFEIVFRCYQSKYVEDKDIECEIYDEVDFAMTSKYRTCIEDSPCSKKIGLTATNTEDLNVFKDKVDTKLGLSQADIFTDQGEITDLITKGQLLQILLPVKFRYPLEEAIADGVLIDYKTMVINHTLDNSVWNLKLYKNQYGTGFSEEKYYKECLKKSFTVIDPEATVQERTKLQYVKELYYRKSCKLLYNLPSKANVLKRLIQRLPNKTILLVGVEKELLLKITPNVIDTDNIDTILDKYNRGEINVISTAKMLSRGKTLTRIPEYIIFASYYGKSTDFLQKLGRVVRYVEGQQAKIIFIKTVGTHEDRWMESLTLVKDSKGNVVRTIDLKIEKIIDANKI